MSLTPLARIHEIGCMVLITLGLIACSNLSLLLLHVRKFLTSALRLGYDRAPMHVFGNVHICTCSFVAFFV